MNGLNRKSLKSCFLALVLHKESIDIKKNVYFDNEIVFLEGLM